MAGIIGLAGDNKEGLFPSSHISYGYYLSNSNTTINIGGFSYPTLYCVWNKQYSSGALWMLFPDGGISIIASNNNKFSMSFKDGSFHFTNTGGVYDIWWAKYTFYVFT